MTNGSPGPRAQYQARVTELEAEERRLQVRGAWLLVALFGAFAVAAGTGVAAYHRLLGGPLAVASLCPLVAIVWFLLQSRRRHFRTGRLATLYDAALGRLDHRSPEKSQTGEVFRREGHLYDRDLDVLGPASLFGLLATTRTGLGQRALAETLLTSPENTAERQLAVQELTLCAGLRESIALLGVSAFAPTPHDTFDLWLAQPSAALPSLLGAVLGVTFAIAALLTVAWGFGLLAADTLMRNLAAVLALQGALALRYRGRVLPILEATLPLPAQLQILRDGLVLLRAQPFRSSLLLQLQERSAGAAVSLAELHRHLILVEQRRQEWFYLPFLLVCAGTQAAIRLDRWKATHGIALRNWLEAWATFDALNALATYAFEHPANTYPELLPETHPATFEATGLTHPLLADAVPNDVALGADRRFYLISGSNMSGKSTLLRAVGLGVVLARAGAPVPATWCRLTPLGVGASLALTDSLAEGRSRFLAEVLRLREILTLARARPTLFLIDELFAGTNSSDRRTAAQAVLGELLAAGAIGALSTHDLALTTLVRAENCGENRHMGSPNPDDPLGFDYLLKPGANPTTNALAFLRLLGLGDRESLGDGHDGRGSESSQAALSYISVWTNHPSVQRESVKRRSGPGSV